MNEEEIKEEEIKKFKKLLVGERAGIALNAFCGTVLILSVILFSVGAATDNADLKIAALSVCPVTMALAICSSAYCYFTFGRAKDRFLKEKVRDIFIENAATLRPDRSSLTYYVTIENNKAYIKTNDYKERVTFDFTPLGKNAVSRPEIAALITHTLTVTFCRLYDRGAKYTDVNYRIVLKEKTKKPVTLIADGKPDKTAYKYYLKNSRI